MVVFCVNGAEDLPVDGVKGALVPMVAVTIVLLEIGKSGGDANGSVQAAGDGNTIDVELDVSVREERNFVDRVGEVGDFSSG